MNERDRKGGAHASRKYTVLYVLMVLCVVGMAVFTWLLIRDDREYSRGDATYKDIRSAIFAAESKYKEEGEDGTGEGAAAIGADSESSIDFRALLELNADIVGWIVGGETIDYPIVQGADNHYYLSHLVNHERNRLGSIFMDQDNQRDFSDRVTVLYGHNMKDGSMFAALTKYNSQSYYDRFPAMTLHLPKGDYEVELFAGKLMDGNDESACFGLIDEEGFQSWIDGLRRASTFQSAGVVMPEDRIVVMCTCSYVDDNARYAVFGRLVPAGD